LALEKLESAIRVPLQETERGPRPPGGHSRPVIKTKYFPLIDPLSGVR